MKKVITSIIVCFSFMMSVSVYAESTKLELSSKTPEANEAFCTNNMFPGDVISQEYEVIVHHKEETTLTFEAVITDETKNLGEVLMVEIINAGTGEVMFDGNFKELNEKELTQVLPKVQGNKSTVKTQITVSMDTSVGNEYQNALLTADFHWTVLEEETLVPPNTRDEFNGGLWISLAGISLVMLIFLLKRKGKSNDE